LGFTPFIAGVAGVFSCKRKKAATTLLDNYGFCVFSDGFGCGHVSKGALAQGFNSLPRLLVT